MRFVATLFLMALVACSDAAKAQIGEELNTKCETVCRSSLDQCAASSNKIMETALKETSAYSVGTPARERADITFERAFLTAENCWDKYYVCAEKCRAPKRCVNACQSTFKQCFAAGERKMREGLREMRKAKIDSPEWQAAYAKGDMETDRCLQDNRNCHAKCANP